jgi:Actinobacteria/chloroflexi VLRF1 release factor
VVTRVVEVPPERLIGWVERYTATHPDTVVSLSGDGIRLDAGGQASAEISPLLPFTFDDSGPATDLVGALAAHAAAPVVTALVLVRRGGFAVGIARGATLAQSKVGSRYVQSRTAAGGWSQQRFARRREGQAKELVRAAAAAWAELPRGAGGTPTVLVTGGDRALCEQVLADGAARELQGLDRRRHVDVPDPRLTVLRQAAGRAHALLVTVREPAS